MGGKLCLKPQYDIKDKDGLEAHALSCRTKYVRLVQRQIKGRIAWYAQLIQEGVPYLKGKNKIQEGVVGLDIGPSSIAIVSCNTASLQAFCPELDDTRKKIAISQRKISRSLRLTNPDNFESNSMMLNKNSRPIKKLGKVKKGQKTWVRSKKYQALRVQTSELQRKMAATRKSAHGKLANKVIINH